MIYTRHLTLREMVDNFEVPEHIARFIIAIEAGETEGCIKIIPDPDTALDSGDVVEGAAKKDQSRAAKMG